MKEIYDMFNLLDNMQNVTIDKFYKFETAGGGALPYFDESQPPGIPPAGKVEEMRKYQKHNWIITTKDKKSVGFLISKRK